MKIGVFTEGGYQGKVQRNNPNMRTDLAWWCALDATHHCVFKLDEINEHYDIGICIVPKEKWGISASHWSIRGKISS